MAPALPTPRGPLTSALLAHLSDGEPLDNPSLRGVDPLRDDDLHLALWCCYELHGRGFAGVDDDAEWDPDVQRFRRILEGVFEGALRAEHQPTTVPSDPRVALRVIGTWAGPPLASTVSERGELGHLRELAVHRSAYQLKEADPHTWAIPRLFGSGRSALIEIQSDEYGHGAPDAAHSELFAAAMDQLGLCSEYGHYVDRLPGVSLATDNLASMFGLNRRLRGALVGHLALFEMCSVTPMSRYLSAARRVGGLPALERFYEVHVEVDAHHADLALNQMVGGIVADEPDLQADIVFGAAALSRVEARFAGHILRSWDEGITSLRPSLEGGLGMSSDPIGVSAAVHRPQLRGLGHPAAAGDAPPQPRITIPRDANASTPSLPQVS